MIAGAVRCEVTRALQNGVLQPGGPQTEADAGARMGPNGGRNNQGRGNDNRQAHTDVSPHGQVRGPDYTKGSPDPLEPPTRGDVEYSRSGQRRGAVRSVARNSPLGATTRRQLSGRSQTAGSRAGW